ncbi:MAG TPA: hypothetical protein VIM31_03375 [Candidatus Microsaccharimonas sp.]
MSIQHYEVIGEHSAPEDFNNYVASRFREGKLQIVAEPTEVDELTARRGETDTRIEFDFRIRETHRDNDTLVLGGTYHNGEKDIWIQIEVTDRVRFDITG